MSIADVYWREPLWLWLAAGPAVLWAFNRLRDRRALAAYAEPRLWPWVLAERPANRRRAILRGLAYALAWLLLAVAAAGPRTARELPESLRTGAVMWVVDVSRSMHAVDAKPDRLGAALALLANWAMKPVAVPTGVVMFAARAHLLLPPTRDGAALRAAVSLSSTIDLPTRGSDAAAALSLAAGKLAAYPRPRAIILFSDGDYADEMAGKVREVAADLARAGITLAIVGTGGPAPAAIATGPGRWLVADGLAVVSRLRETRLRDLADAGGGAYGRLQADVELPMSALWRPPARSLPPDIADDIAWREWFAWFLLPGMILLGISVLRLAPIALALLVALVPADPVRADAEDAFASYRAGDYAAARAAYGRLPGYAARMGEGAACYRLRDYECAVRVFAKAAWHAQSDPRRADAAFNLGNSFFQLGDYAGARTLYRDVVGLRPDFKPARRNLAFARALENAVKQRLREAGVAQRGRPARGVRFGQLPQGADITPGMRLRMSESEGERFIPGAPAAVSDAALNALLARGVEFARARSGARETQSSTQKTWNTTAKGPRRPGDPSLLWRRLFEAEEGFPAPVSEPIELPGVRPW